MIKFNDTKNKKNYRIVEGNSDYSFEKYELEFNLLKNIWIPVREWHKNKYLDIIHNVYYVFAILFITLSLFISFNIFSIMFVVFGAIYIFYSFTLNEKIRYGNISEFDKELEKLTNPDKNRKIVVGFNAKGEKITGKDLDRVTKLRKFVN